MRYDSTLPATIIGGGLSGCVLALKLISVGMMVRVIDRGNGQSASRAAAGVINPITGMRYSRSWRVDDFLPAAIHFYTEVEQEAGVQLWHPLAVCRLFKSPELRDGFFKRRSLEQLSPYAKRMVEPGEDVGPVFNAFGGVWIEGGGWVDLAAFLDVARQKIEACGEWVEQEVSVRELCGQTRGLVVDCRGFQPDQELWPDLEWKAAHGDILTFESDGCSGDRILNRSQFILPVGAGRFRFGATYDWDVGEAEPRDKGRRDLLRAYSEWVKLGEPKLVAHHAGIRPIIRDQKPVLGWHPSISHLAIFNGMGSKGGSWAPKLAEELIDFLEGRQELAAEINVVRYISA